MQKLPPNGPAAPDQSQRCLHGFAHHVALILDPAWDLAPGEIAGWIFLREEGGVRQKS
jgi:hypothetical protein